LRYSLIHPDIENDLLLQQLHPFHMANRVCASPSSQYTEKHLLNYELVLLLWVLCPIS
jgi:hypothetical protein